MIAAASTGLALPPLPPALRGSRPAELRGLRRDQVRLLVIDRARDEVGHSRFDRLGDRLGAGDLLVVNTSRTLPAAVAARRASGELVQLRPCVRWDGAGGEADERPGSSRPPAGGESPHLWDALAVEPEPPHQNVVLDEGEELHVGGARLRVLRRRTDIPFLWRLSLSTSDDLDLILKHGEPIRYSYVPEPVPLDLYQPVYASHPGSAESPSAGRPLTWELLAALRSQGVGLAQLVLHTGLSSFQDDDFDAEHHLFEEWFQVSEETAAAVASARRVVAVGTTVVRALESAADADGKVRPVSGWTSLAVTRARPPLVVDALLTGMHEPQASHFDLLQAFVPEALLSRAYHEAVAHGYLWHEFGDATLVL